MVYSHSLAPTPYTTPQRCLDCTRTVHSLCTNLTEQEIAHIARFSHRTHLPHGSLLIEEGSPAIASFTILSGTVRVFKSLADGRRQIIGFIDAGQFLNGGVRCDEANNDNGTYTFGAETINTVHFCRFQHNNFNPLLKDFPHLGRVLLTSLTAHITKAQEQMLLLGRKTSREKIASFLLHRLTLPLTEKNTTDSSASDSSFPLFLPMSRVDIADYLGLTVETVSRTMSTFRREGIITSSGHHTLRVTNIAALRALANGQKTSAETSQSAFKANV